MPLNFCSSFHRFLDTLFWLDIDTFVDLLDFAFGDEINAEYKTHLESRLKSVNLFRSNGETVIETVKYSRIGTLTKYEHVKNNNQKDFRLI